MTVSIVIYITDAIRKYFLGCGKDGRVNWYKDWVWLISPSPQQCQEVAARLTHHHKTIVLESTYTYLADIILAPILHIPDGVKKIQLWDTRLSQRTRNIICQNCKQINQQQNLLLKETVIFL